MVIYDILCVNAHTTSAYNEGSIHQRMSYCFSRYNKTQQVSQIIHLQAFTTRKTYIKSQCRKHPHHTISADFNNSSRVTSPCDFIYLSTLFTYSVSKTLLPTTLLTDHIIFAACISLLFLEEDFNDLYG